MLVALQEHKKAQPAMTRMSRELMELTNIEAWDVTGSNPYILYHRLPDQDTAAVERYGLHFESTANQLLLYTQYGGNPPLTGGGDLLLDDVSDFNFNFYSGNNAWAGGDNAGDGSFSSVGFGF